jgi:hypothetical protein
MKISTWLGNVCLFFVVWSCFWAGGTRLRAQGTNEIKPPKISEGKQAIKLPGTVADWCVGGNGRYVLMLFKDLQKIGILDVNELKIIGYVAAPDANTKFAASATKLLTVASTAGVITRWDLATQAKELTKSLEVQGELAHLLLGSASEGPAVMGMGDYYKNATKVIDLQTLEVKALEFSKNGRASRGLGKDSVVNISANGELVTVWSIGTSPSGLQTYVKSGDAWEAHYQHDSPGALFPSADGRYVYSPAGIFNAQTTAIKRQTGNERTIMIPAVHGPLYCRVFPDRLTVHIAGDDRIFATVSNMDKHFDKDAHPVHIAKTKLDKNLLFIPNANLFLKLSTSLDLLTAVEFDVSKALSESNLNYLIPTSIPVVKAAVGQAYSYPIKVLASSKAIKYQLESGPTGMTVSPQGVVSWTPDANSPAKNQIIVHITDDKGEAAFHSFPLLVQGGSTKTVEVAPVANQQPIHAPQVASTKLPEPNQTIKLPGNVTDVSLGANGRYVFLRLSDQRKFAVFDVTEGKIIRYLPMPEDNCKIIAGSKQALVFQLTNNLVSRYRLDNFEKELTTTLPFTGVVNQVSMGINSSNYAVLRVSKGTEQLDRSGFEFLDVNTLKPADLEKDKQANYYLSYRDRAKIVSSADGYSHLIAGQFFLKVNDRRLEFKGSRHDGAAAAMLADAQGFFNYQGQLLSPDFKTLTDVKDGYGFVIPAATGRLFLSLPSDRQRQLEKSAPSRVAVYLLGESRPLLNLTDLKLPQKAPGEYTWNDALDLYQRVLFIPEAGVIITIPDSNDALNVRKFDLDQELADSGVDYLFVASTPIETAKLGETYQYPIKIKSKVGGLVFQLDSSPAGMTITKEGVISWKVAANTEQEKQNVIVSITDSKGQSVFHTFAIHLPELKEKKLALERAAKEKQIQAQLAEQKAQQERMEQQRRAIQEQREQKLAAQRPSQSALTDAPRFEPNSIAPVTAPPAFNSRSWTDATGKFKITATFIEIKEKKMVILKLPDGKELSIELAKLSNEDIYEAVKSDLQKSSAAPAAVESPFKPTTQMTNPEKADKEPVLENFKPRDLPRVQVPSNPNNDRKEDSKEATKAGPATKSRDPSVPLKSQ